MKKIVTLVALIGMGAAIYFLYIARQEPGTRHESVVNNDQPVLSHDQVWLTTLAAGKAESAQTKKPLLAKVGASW
jgi:hypothetical protein